MTSVRAFIAYFIFWGFIATKAFGTVFATWSWRWLLLPIMPWLGLAVQRLGL